MAFIQLEMFDESDLHEDIVNSDYNNETVELPDEDLSDVVNIAIGLVLMRRDKKDQKVEQALNELERTLIEIRILKEFNC